MIIERLELLNRLANLTADARLTAEAIDAYASKLHEPKRYEWRYLAENVRGDMRKYERLTKEVRGKETQAQ